MKIKVDGFKNPQYQCQGQFLLNARFGSDDSQAREKKLFIFRLKDELLSERFGNSLLSNTFGAEIIKSRK